MSIPSEPPARGWIRQTGHYENFPIASRLVPAHLRPAVAAVYRFARYADDVADEGEADPATRIAELDTLEAALSGRASHPVVDPLHAHLANHRVDPELLRALLSAFRQDAAGPRFADRISLLNYCQRSANPVGRIVLRLFDADSTPALPPSDHICTALQLINFAQDIGQDIGRGRCYIPADELAAGSVTCAELRQCASERRITPAVRALVNDQTRRALEHLHAGMDLLALVSLRLRLELAAIIAGGHTAAQGVLRSDPFAVRIKLGKSDAPVLLARWLSVCVLHRLS